MVSKAAAALSIAFSASAVLGQVVVIDPTLPVATTLPVNVADPLAVVTTIPVPVVTTLPVNVADPLAVVTTLPVVLPTTLPVDLTTLVTLPTLPVTLPTLPVTLPTLPVTLPTLPITLPITLLPTGTAGVPPATTASNIGGSGLAGGASNTVSGFGSSTTPIPDPNGGSGIGSTGNSLGSGNNTMGGGSNIGAAGNGINGTSPNGGGAVGPTSNTAGLIASMSPSALYTAIVTQQISVTTVLSVVTSLSPQQLLAIQNAFSAQQASLQNCYAPVVCLTNTANPGQLAGGTLVVSTLNGQSTTFQIPAGSGSSGSANYVVTSSGAGTLKNAAAAVQSMSTLPASTSGGSRAAYAFGFVGLSLMTMFL